MGRPSNTEARRQQIVEGLLEVMADVGYQKASIQRIAQAAGLAAGLVHYHFSSKGEVLLALLDHLEAGIWRRYQERLGGPGAADPQARLEAFVFAHVGRGPGEDPSRVRAWLALEAEALHDLELGPLVRRSLEKRREVLDDILRQVLRTEGRRRRGAPRLTAAMLAALDGALWLGVLAPEAVPPGSAHDSILAMAKGLVAGEPPRRGRA